MGFTDMVAEFGVSRTVVAGLLLVGMLTFAVVALVSPDALPRVQRSEVSSTSARIAGGLNLVLALGFLAALAMMAHAR